MKRTIFSLILLCILASCSNGPSDTQDTILTQGGVLNTEAPEQTVKICFIHHSTGSDWISNSSGGLGAALNASNFYTSETDYGWDAETGDDIGSHTDTGDWQSWFNDTIMQYVYDNNHNEDYTNNGISDPSGENSIIMFKSCYPCSDVGVSFEDEQEIYNDLLSYFAGRQDKMFILVIPPPMITIPHASITRELSQWLVDRENGWLADYEHDNVYAFNYYNILTDPKNHHHVNSQGVEEIIVSANPTDAANPDELYYYNDPENNHPTAVGHQKATDEFLPLLRGWYNKWKHIE